ncbi:MAG: bifunctional UDP-N-acetylglucosamine pyrophosphorylase/glucosamine-1-phosphate N-acetyltransferase [Candidatus Aldehydirespiratoraceae bacterium]
MVPLAAPSIVIVGTGADYRMRSATPKALHQICGRSLLDYVVEAAHALGPRRLTVVVGPSDDETEKELADGIEVTRVPANVAYDDCAAVLAALMAWSDDDLALDLDFDDDDVLIVPASVPLLQGHTLRSLYRAHRSNGASATELVAPAAKDTTEDRTDGAIWFVRRSLLAPALRRAETPSVSAIGEVLRDIGHDVATVEAEDPAECRVVFDRTHLAEVEAAMRSRINDRWMRRGVTMRDPNHTFIDWSADLAADVVLASGVVLRGTTSIGQGTEVGPGCQLVDSRVGAQCRLDSTSAALATIGDDARVGPFAVLEPGSEIPSATVTGPFYTAGPDAR